jgi:hypothetical protein
VQRNLTGAQISCPSTCEGSETNRIPRKERIALDPRCLSAAEASAWVRTSRVGLQLGCCLRIFPPYRPLPFWQWDEVFRPRHLYYLHTRSIGVIV